jgi:hypothetical protein
MKYKVILIITAFIVINISCNRGANRDYSLSIQEYLDMGVPDPNSVWNTEEIGMAIDVFSGTKWDKPYILPKKGSKKSGALFHRMISLENMTFLRNDTIELHEKALLSLQFLQIFEKWKDVYTHPMWKKQYYHRELVDININEVRVTETMVDLTKQVMASNDPAVVMLQQGIPQVKMNYISSVINALNLQSHTSQFLEKDMELLADSLSATVLRNKVWMDSTSMARLKESVELVLDSTSSEYVRGKYKIITEEL